jgi:ATP-binding cassette subfamily F protein 3
MAHLQLSGVSLAFGARKILHNVSLHLKEDSRAALSGINGSGKSTLLKVIAGEIEPDEGSVSCSKGSVVAYLPQSTGVLGDKTLYAFMQDSYRAAAPDDDHPEGDAASWRRDKEIGIVLTGLGFSAAQFDQKITAFSSGWKMRIALARVLLQNADFLLLDEPTNYLDIEARSWLLSFLRTFKGGFLLVSHDRFFLDNAITEVDDLFQGSLKRYAGNYSAYEKQHGAELDELIKRHAEQQEEIKKNEDIIRRFRYKASKAAMVQERIKKLEKMERVEIPENLKKVSITFPPPPHSGNIALTLKAVEKNYGNKTVIKNLDLQIDAGERLVVAGKNGAGKSTLLRIIGGVDADYEGDVLWGAGISAGYFSVENAENLALSMKGDEYTGKKREESIKETALSFMEKDAPLSLLPKVRDMLGAFLFRGDDVYKPLNVLSGGEKSRLALLKLLTKPLNLLILDEPTNHLDIWTKDILLDALDAFRGTIIFVCHDRAFMERLSTKTLYLEDGTHTLYYGGYHYFLEKTGADESNVPRNTAALSSAGTAGNSGANTMEVETPPLDKTYRAEQKKRQAEERRRKKREEELVDIIDELEAGRARLLAELSEPENYANGEKAKRLKEELLETETAIEKAAAEWEALAADI